MRQPSSSDHEKGDQGVFQMQIADPTSDVPERLYVEATDAFCASTEIEHGILLRYVYGWTFAKDSPEEVERMRRLRDSDEPT